MVASLLRLPWPSGIKMAALKLAKISAAPIILLALSGCACQPVTVYEQVPLAVPSPDEPILGVSVEDYRTMTDDVYDRVKTRDDRLLRYIDQLRAVIGTTQE